MIDLLKPTHIQLISNPLPIYMIIFFEPTFQFFFIKWNVESSPVSFSQHLKFFFFYNLHVLPMIDLPSLLFKHMWSYFLHFLIIHLISFFIIVFILQFRTHNSKEFLEFVRHLKIIHFFLFSFVLGFIGLAMEQG